MKKYQTIRRTIFMLGVLFFLSQSAYSQQQKKIEVEVISFEELMNIMVSVASKTEQTIGDAPSTVSVITHEQMVNMGVKSLEELLNYVPGFMVYRTVSGNKRDYITVRGGQMTDILFLYNGQRLNGHYEGQLSDGTQYVPIENIKQVEIIRGPGSALYGSNAFLGVVNIVTVDNLNNVSVSAGSFDRREAAINISTKIDDLTVAAFVQGFSDMGQKYTVTDVNNIKGDTRDPYSGFNATLTMKYKNWTFNARHNEAQQNDFIMFSALGNGLNNVKSTQSFLNLKYNWAVNDRLEIDISTGYLADYWNAVFLQITVGGLPVKADPFTLNSQVIGGGPYLTTYTANLNIDGKYKVSETNNLIAGLSFEHGEITEASNQGLWNYEAFDAFRYYGTLQHNIPGKEFNHLAKRDIVGIYAQDEQKIGSNFSITFGARFDSYSDFGSSINPRLAVIYSTPFDSKFKFMFGKAFRSPNFSELYDKNNPTYLGNPGLGAVKVTTFEGAFIQDAKIAQFTFTYFNSEITSIIVPNKRIDPNDPNSPKLYDNIGAQRIHGLEIEAKAAPDKSVYITFGFSHLFNTEALEVPANTASASVNFHSDAFNANFTGLYRDKMELINGQDSYIIFNTKLAYNLVGSVKLNLYVSNIFDTQYSTYAAGFASGIINRGRAYTLGVDFGL